MAYGNVTVQNRDIGADIWTQMLKQAQGLQSGSIDPWELPEYKQFQNQYQDWMDKFMKNLYSQASAKGMNPGAAMQQLKDQIPQQLGTAMQDFTTKAYGRIMPTAQGGINNFNDLISQWFKSQQLDMQKDKMNQDERDKWIGMGTGMLDPLGKMLGGGFGGMSSGLITKNPATGQSTPPAGGCQCRIFTEDWTKELEIPVERFRDEHYSPNSYVSRGYKKMSRWLVPLMMKSKIVRKIVRSVMLKPMSKFATHYYNKNIRSLLYMPFGLFWTGVWRISGRMYGVSTRPLSA